MARVAICPTIKLTVWTIVDDQLQLSIKVRHGAMDSNFFHGLTIEWAVLNRVECK